VYRFDEDSRPVPLTGGGIGIPLDIAVGSRGELFVADPETGRIWRVPADGGMPREFAAVPAVRRLGIDAQDRLWAVTGDPDALLVRIGRDGRPEPVVPDAPFRFPQDVAVTPDGAAYVSDNYARAIWKINPDGTAAKWLAGDPLGGPVGLALEGKDVLIADPKAAVVLRVDEQGTPSVVVAQDPKAAP
jgi:sugar lactone lactonase YvrE